MGRNDDEEKKHRAREGDDEKKSDRKRRHHKSSKHRDEVRKEKSRKRDDSRRRRRDSSEESSTSSEHHKDRKRRKKEKKHRKKTDKREKKAKKKDRKKSKQESESDNDSSLLDRNYIFADALHSLLEIKPGMASELPILLIRLASGASFNLSQMPDARVLQRLEKVLDSLSSLGVEKDATGSWVWKAPGGGPRSNASEPLLLVRVARALLDQIGVTMEAVESYTESKQHAGTDEIEKEIDPLSAKTALLLEKFDKGNDTGSLAQELGSLCKLILSGESIALDGLPNEELREAMEGLFETAGLEKTEMEGSDDDDDEEEDDDDGEGESSMGYALPDEGGSSANANIARILEVCKDVSTAAPKPESKRAVRGPAMMPPQDPTAVYTGAKDDSDDDEGPAPLGSEKAKARIQNGSAMAPEVVKEMAEQRKRELAGVVTGREQLVPAGSITEREQWMVEPGEHKFLDGIKAFPIKTRNFKHEKKSGTEDAQSAPMDAAAQEEMDAIVQLHREARGPSLVEQHRLKKAEERGAAGESGSSKWKWSRDKDLDSGRRVDKNALNMIMGGASGDLKDKFQGSYSKGFM